MYTFLEVAVSAEASNWLCNDYSFLRVITAKIVKRSEIANIYQNNVDIEYHLANTFADTSIIYNLSW